MDGRIRSLYLTEPEIAAMLAFLKTLTAPVATPPSP